jgi:hypothetical protein
MDDETARRRARDVGKRIASLIQSIGQGPEKQITRDEWQKLKDAAERLDQMLKAARDTERQALRDAAGRLDRLLVDIGKGKDVSNQIKRRRDRQEPR